MEIAKRMSNYSLLNLKRSYLNSSVSFDVGLLTYINMLPLHHTIATRPTNNKIILFFIYPPFFSDTRKASYIKFDKIEVSIKILILMAPGFEPRPVA